MNFNDYKIIRKIVNKNFTWGDLNPKYDNIAQLRCNVFCPMHLNTDTPSAKFYYNEDEEIWTLFCFTEKKVFDAYDYLDKIICKQWQKYKSPMDFLRQRMSEGELIRQYLAIEKQGEFLTESNYEKKIEYINNVYDEVDGDTVYYIERLYTA